MTVKRCISERFALVFAEKARIPKGYVINFVARALAVKPVPFLCRLLSFSGDLQEIYFTKREREKKGRKRKEREKSENDCTLYNINHNAVA